MNDDRFGSLFSTLVSVSRKSGKAVVLCTKAKEMADLINEFSDPCREQSLAMTNLEQAVIWAIMAGSKKVNNKVESAK